MEEVKSFNDVMPKTANFEGEKIADLHDLKDKDVVVKDFEIVESNKFREGGKFAVISASLQEKAIVFNGSEIMVNQLQKIGKDKLPFKATVKKVKAAKSGRSYFCFS